MTDIARVVVARRGLVRRNKRRSNPIKSYKLVPLLGLLLLINDTAVYADILPGGAQSEQMTRAITQQLPQPQPRPIAPVEAPPQEEAPSPLGASAQKIKFILREVVLEGNKTFTTQQLRPIYKDKLGKEITVAQLFEIVQGITNYYRNSGYIISRAILPPQHVKEGVVRIQIIEGYIGTVSVSGNPRGAKCYVQALGNEIKKSPPLQVSRMEKYLLLANEIPGTEVRAVMEPAKKDVGASDITLVTQNKLAMGYLSYDNYGTRYIGPQQMTGSFSLNSFIGSGDVGRVTLTKTPKGGELTYWDANYITPITNGGITGQIGGTRTHTHPLFVLQPVQIDGLNDNYYTMFQFPIIRTRSSNLTARTGFSYVDVHTTILDTNLYTDHLRNLDIGATYNFADSWYGANMISGDFRQGLPILGYSSDYNPDTAETSRPGGRGDYTKFAIQASRLQAIKGPWSLYGILTGQWAFNPLLSSEQFTVGGSQIGRGYDVAELIGDKGISGSLELRYDLAVGTILNSLQLYVFYDGGEIWNLKTSSGSPGKLSITSTGFGTRFYFTKYISGNLYWAQPLTKQVAAEELIGEGRRPRVFFSIAASFG